MVPRTRKLEEFSIACFHIFTTTLVSRLVTIAILNKEETNNLSRVHNVRTVVWRPDKKKDSTHWLKHLHIIVAYVWTWGKVVEVSYEEIVSVFWRNILIYHGTAVRTAKISTKEKFLHGSQTAFSDNVSHRNSHNSYSADEKLSQRHTRLNLCKRTRIP